MGHLSDFLDLLKGTNVDDSIRGKYEGVARKKILFMDSILSFCFDADLLP